MMTTKTKVEFTEQSKCVVARVHIESDDLTQDEVLEKTKELFEKAQIISSAYSTLK